MLLPLLTILLQTSGSPVVGQPVRLTLEPSAVAPAEPVHVFVEVATPGHLLVLRVASDGRTEVVFPSVASEGTFVEVGSYEIRPAERQAAFIAAEPAGSGVVLAALAQVPYEFDEFLRGGAWDPIALASAGVGADATGRLLDIVQRMLGPEYFQYDVAAYTVARYPVSDPAVTGLAYGGFASCWGYGCMGSGWYGGWAPVHPCLYGRWGCGFDSSFCGGLADRGWCDWSCRGEIGCREWSRQTAIARYRRGVPLVASESPAAPSPGEPSPPAPVRPRRREPGAGTPVQAIVAARSVSRGSGKGVAPEPARAAGTHTGSSAVSRRPRQAVRDEATVPERVAWPGTAIARGQKTTPPAVRPREARLKQSASRPPMPERVPWPTGGVAHSAKPVMGAGAVSVRSAPPPTGGVSVARAVEVRAGAASPVVGSARSLAPAAPARVASPAVATSGASHVARTDASARAGSQGGARAYMPARAAPSSGGAVAGGGRSGKH